MNKSEDLLNRHFQTTADLTTQFSMWKTDLPHTFLTLAWPKQSKSWETLDPPYNSSKTDGRLFSNAWNENGNPKRQRGASMIRIIPRLRSYASGYVGDYFPTLGMKMVTRSVSEEPR